MKEAVEVIKAIVKGFEIIAPSLNSLIVAVSWILSDSEDEEGFPSDCTKKKIEEETKK